MRGKGSVGVRDSTFRSAPIPILPGRFFVLVVEFILAFTAVVSLPGQMTSSFVLFEGLENTCVLLRYFSEGFYSGPSCVVVGVFFCVLSMVPPSPLLSPTSLLLDPPTPLLTILVFLGFWVNDDGGDD